MEDGPACERNGLHAALPRLRAFSLAACLAAPVLAISILAASIMGGSILPSPLLAAERPHSGPAPHLRQLSAPFSAAPGSARLYRLRSPHGHAAAPQLARRSRTGKRYLPLRTRQVPAAARLTRERWPHHLRPLLRSALKRRPPVSAEIRADQLLIVPRADGYGDERLHELMAAGIPVIKDVPAIVIVNPPRPERDTPEELVRRLRR